MRAWDAPNIKSVENRSSDSLDMSGASAPGTFPTEIQSNPVRLRLVRLAQRSFLTTSAHLISALGAHDGTSASLRHFLPAQIQLLGELAAVAEPLPFPIEDVDGHDDHDGQTCEDCRGVFEFIFCADVFVDWI